MLYLSFPVAMFWISNQAEYFEEYIVKRKVSVFATNYNHVSPLSVNLMLFIRLVFLFRFIQREIFPPDEEFHVSNAWNVQMWVHR